LLENLLPALMDHFAQRLQAPAEKPMLFASHDPGSDDGRYGSKGGTLPGQVFMHFYGAGWDDPDRAGWLRRWMPWFFAHEAAHLFQQYERSADPAASWIHEGGAEAFAYLALQGMPGSGIPGDFLDEKLEQAASACAEGLKHGSLADAQADGRFHNHYECGLLMLLVSWWTAWRLRRRAEPTRGQARALLAMSFSGWVATLAGWYVTEIGRQPWLVTGVLRTADAVSATPAPMVGISLAAYLLLYAVLLAAYVSVLFHLARRAGKIGRASAT